MELAKQIVSTLNVPILNMTKVSENTVAKLLNRHGISTMNELKAKYGNHWVSAFRTDWCKQELWGEYD